MEGVERLSEHLNVAISTALSFDCGRVTSVEKYHCLRGLRGYFAVSGLVLTSTTPFVAQTVPILMRCIYLSAPCGSANDNNLLNL